MVLVITNNENTKNMVCKYIHFKEFVVEFLNVDLVSYIDKEFMNKNLERFDRIIIDISKLSDNKEEILKSITKIKVIYGIQIIIIALNCKVGDELLSELFNIGIYDFIISEDEESQKEEWIKALDKNNYIDAVKFKIDNTSKKKKIKKVSKSKLKKSLKEEVQVGKKMLTCFSFIKSRIPDILTFLGYGIITILVSIGATALINANVRMLIIEIIKGGI